MKLVKYDAVRKALAQATRVDEVKTIRDKAIAMQTYAKQARDGELIGMATDIRLHAEVRAGELLITMAKGGERAKSKDTLSRGNTKLPRELPKLSDLGVSKIQSSRWQALARLPRAKQEAMIAQRIRIVVAAAENYIEVIKEARAERHKVKKAKRDSRMRELSDKIEALPQRTFAVILADPEWRWEAWSEKGLDGTSADNQYPTSTLEDIKARDVPSICADDCVLFLWATVPMLPHALEVMTAWGFDYVSNFVWVKDKAGTGYWNRNQHEHLLVGTRGNISAPLEGTQWPSVIQAPRRRHSEKPDAVYEMIEEYYSDLPKIELNARKARKGWERWGNEAPAEAAE